MICFLKALFINTNSGALNDSASCLEEKYNQKETNHLSLIHLNFLVGQFFLFFAPHRYNVLILTLCGDFQNVWLLLRSGSQNKGINCRYSGQNLLLYLLFSYICPS